MVYENNLKSLKKHSQTIFNFVCKEDVVWNEEETGVIQAKNSELVMVYKKDQEEVLLNSKYNPTAEANKYLDELRDMPEKSLVIMFGFANGVFAREILSMTNEQVGVIVYEPSISIFMQALKAIDITDILENERFTIIVEGINTKEYGLVLDNSLRSYNINNNKHIMLPKYAKLFQQEYNDFAEKTEELYEINSMGTNTIVGYGQTICTNNILNMKYLPGCQSGVDYVDKFPGEMPVIIVSAGPSLAKNKHLLKDAKGKALIVVVDTAIPHILSMGVKPDMVISVDYMKDLKYFTDKELSDVPFIAISDSNVKVLELVNPKQVIFASADDMIWDTIFSEVGSSINQLELGGSVATVAIANVISWGFKKIILIGQDLTFTGGATHIGSESTEFDMSSGEYAYVKGINGEDLITRKDYLSYLRWIESVGYRFSDIQIIDATEGGALKQYTTVMTFRDAIDKYCTKEYDIEGIISSVPRLFLGEDRAILIKTLESMKQNLRNLRAKMKQGSVDCHRGSVLLSRGDYNIKELKKINDSIEKLDEYYIDCDERVLLSKYIAADENDFDSDMYDCEKDDIKESIRMYDKCEKFYSSIGDAVPKIIELIAESLVAINEGN